MAKSRAREGYIRVEGGRVWYRVAGGEGGGVPMLTLHGGANRLRRALPREVRSTLGAE